MVCIGVCMVQYHTIDIIVKAAKNGHQPWGLKRVCFEQFKFIFYYVLKTIPFLVPYRTKNARLVPGKTKNAKNLRRYKFPPPVTPEKLDGIAYGEEKKETEKSEMEAGRVLKK